MAHVPAQNESRNQADRALQQQPVGGVPRIISLCSEGGREDGSDVRGDAINLSHPSGAAPPLFHNCVLPLWSRIRAWSHISRSKDLRIAATRAGAQHTYTSSMHANKRSASRNSSLTRARARCWPRRAQRGHEGVTLFGAPALTHAWRPCRRSTRTLTVCCRIASRMGGPRHPLQPPSGPATLQMRSNAPIPSTDSNVVVGFRSVIA